MLTFPTLGPFKLQVITPPQSSLFVLQHPVQQQQTGDVTHMEAFANERAPPVLQRAEGAVVQFLVWHDYQVTRFLHLEGPESGHNNNVHFNSVVSTQYEQTQDKCMHRASI